MCEKRAYFVFFPIFAVQKRKKMPVRFTLEKRTNKQGECPIRISWSFCGRRYQTTLRISVKETDWDEENRMVRAEAHNQNGQSADKINLFIKRVELVVSSIEQHFHGNEKELTKEMMKRAVSDALSEDIARPEDILRRDIEGLGSQPEQVTEYYEGPDNQYYKLICDAKSKFNSDRFKILQELFGRRDRIIVPENCFKPFRESGNMYPTTKYKKIDYKKVFGV